jgi:hypothetical protein
MKRFLLVFLFGGCFGGGGLNPCIDNDCVCPAGECAPVCDGALADCDVACNNSECTVDCDAIAICDVQGSGTVAVDCTDVGSCDVECSLSSSCEVECLDSDCDVTCPEADCTVRNCTLGVNCDVTCGLAGGIGVQQGADVVCQ